MSDLHAPFDSRQSSLESRSAVDKRTAHTADRPYYASLDSGSTKAQIEQIVDMLVRRRWTLLMTWLLITGIVAAYTFSRVPEYRADSYIMVDLNQIGSLAGEVALGSTNYGNNGRLYTELFILETSRQIEMRVRERLLEEESQASGGSADGQSEPRALQEGRVTVAPASRDVPNAIQVTAHSTVPEDAALLANLYTEEYIRLAREANRTHLSARRSLLAEQESERLEELQRAEEAVRDYTLRNGTVRLDEETSYLVSSIAQLESRHDDAGIELRMSEASLQALESELAAINPKLVERFSSGVERQMQGVQDKLADLQQEKEQILLRNPHLNENDQNQIGPINEQILALQVKMEQLSQEYVDEVIASGGVSNSEEGLSQIADLQRQVTRDRIAINGARSRMEVMNERLAQYQGELSNVPDLSLNLVRLERDRQYSEEQYHSVVQKLQEARLAEESQPGYAQVIREAGVPLRPVSPNIPQNLTLGLLLGLFAGLGLAVVRDKLDNRINKPDELRQRGYYVIGVIPNMRPLIHDQFEGREFVQHDGHPMATSLVPLLSPMASVSEAYRSTRTAIQFSQPDKIIQTLLVTSPSVGEGKSTTAANLAAVMAQSGRRTLLIDADMRRPQQHRLFGFNNERGLVQLLFDKIGPHQDFHKTRQENLYVLTAGGLVDSEGKSSRDGAEGATVTNPAELLGSRRMRALLEVFREEFDMIIIDSPPVLAATDAVLLSTQCDGTLVVTRAGKTKEGELEFSMEALQDVGASIIGTVLNAFDITLAYGYKYRFGTYSKFGYYSKYGYGYSMYQESAKVEKPKGWFRAPKSLS